MTEYRVHAPPEGTVGAFCRFLHYPAIADRAEDVTCVDCLAKLKRKPAPWPRRRAPWRRRR